jgi:hypothetical protein
VPGINGRNGIGSLMVGSLAVRAYIGGPHG